MLRDGLGQPEPDGDGLFALGVEEAHRVAIGERSGPTLPQLARANEKVDRSAPNFDSFRPILGGCRGANLVESRGLAAHGSLIG